MNELRTLIDLCPGIRLPQYEEEIFSDISIREHYINGLCGDFDGKDTHDKLYHYIYETLGGERWPAAECMIIEDTEFAYWYAVNIVKGAWPAAEHLFSSDPIYAYHYAKYILRGRFIIGEPALLKSLYWWPLYQECLVSS